MAASSCTKLPRIKEVRAYIKQADSVDQGTSALLYIVKQITFEHVHKYAIQAYKILSLLYDIFLYVNCMLLYDVTCVWNTKQ